MLLYIHALTFSSAVKTVPLPRNPSVISVLFVILVHPFLTVPSWATVSFGIFPFFADILSHTVVKTCHLIFLCCFMLLFYSLLQYHPVLLYHQVNTQSSSTAVSYGNICADVLSQVVVLSFAAV